MTFIMRLLVAFLVFLGTLAPANAQEDINGLARDAGELAKMKGISHGEATRRLVLQNKFNNYLQSYGDDTLISGDIESTSNVFKLHIRVTKSGVANVLSSRMMLDPSLSESLQVETAPFTPEQLRSAQSALFNALRNQDAATRIDPRAGKLVLQVRNVDLARTLVSNLGLTTMVNVERRDAFPRPVADLGGFYGGGLSLVRSDGARCTTGFTVRRFGVPELLTAGHCILPAMNAPFQAKGAVIDGSINMTFQSAVWSGSQDFAWLFTATTSPSRQIYDGTAPRTMTAGFYTSRRSNRVANGTLLCKYGRSTRYTCQEVINNNFNAVDAANNAIGPLVELGGTALNISQCGDSGGPVFSGGIGYGIISRGDVNGPCLGGPLLYYAPLIASTPLYL